MQPDNSDLLEFNLDGLVLDLQRQGGLDRVAEAISDMMEEGGLTLEDLEKYEAATRSFSNASWQDVASKFNLDGFDQLPTLAFPIASLPPTFHREVMRKSVMWLDVYQSRSSHNGEAARVLFLDAWHVPVCALFKGRLVEQSKSSTALILHGRGTIILLVFVKLEFKNESDHLAKVLVELDLAYRLNSSKELGLQPPVYAVWTDLERFYFLRYDGSHLTCTDAMFVPESPRPQFLAGMRRVSDYLFSVLLEGYISVLDAAVARYTRCGDLNPAQASPDKWSQALGNAREAQDILVGDKGKSLQSWEEVGSRGLFCLNER
ncbi:hypothetical protein BGY98DRAFT_997008 [Russula aff. rugulosa BPL654]|nr:hypothetical protein BGY98DRAFT_997008 [Russula aff. rugulosa BPL654]